MLFMILVLLILYFIKKTGYMKKFFSIFLLFISLFSFAQTSNKKVSKINALPPNTQVWTINSERAQCEGVTTMQCLLVKKQGQKSFEFFYDNIIGFDFERGFTYVIWVKQELKTPPIPSDVSIYKYVLVKVVSKKGPKKVTLKKDINAEDNKKRITNLNESKITTLVVNEEKINCETNPNAKCLLIKKEGAKSFEIFYQNIEGFVFEEGCQQTILVNERYVENPMIKQVLPIYTYIKTLKKEQILTPKTTTTISYPKSILDKKWILRKMKDTDSTLILIEDDGIFIDLKSNENKLTGKAPCNTFFGSLNTDNISTFQVVAVANTRMYCENNMNFENLFFTLLQNSERFESVGGKISLYKGNRLLLVFE